MKIINKRILNTIVFITLGCGATYAQTSEEFHASDLLNKLNQHISIHGYAQGGFFYDNQATPNNTFKISRIIGMLSAKVTNKWDCYFMYSFVGNGDSHTCELWTEYHFNPAFNVKVGQFKTPFSIENPMSPTEWEFSTASQATNYLTGNSTTDVKYGNQSGRDQGIQVSGNLIKMQSGINLLSYKLAIMNGQGINVCDGNSQKDFVGSLTFHPIKDLDLNVSTMLGDGHALATEYAGTQYAIAAGQNYTRNRYSAGLQYKSSIFDVRSEYMYGKDGNHNSDGYYATGEVHVKPQFDIVASYDYFNKNKDMDNQDETDYKAGVQYWFYPRCRMQVEYIYQDKQQGLKDHNMVEAQLQIRF